MDISNHVRTTTAITRLRFADGERQEHEKSEKDESEKDEDLV